MECQMCSVPEAVLHFFNFSLSFCLQHATLPIPPHTPSYEARTHYQQHQQNPTQTPPFFYSILETSPMTPIFKTRKILLVGNPS